MFPFLNAFTTSLLLKLDLVKRIQKNKLNPPFWRNDKSISFGTITSKDSLSELLIPPFITSTKPFWFTAPVFTFFSFNKTLLRFDINLLTSNWRTLEVSFFCLGILPVFIFFYLISYNFNNLNKDYIKLILNKFF